MSQLQTLRKNTKNRISCLNFFVVAVWMPVCVHVKYLRIWSSRNMFQNSMKMRFVPVHLIELLSSTTTRTDQNLL